MILSFSNKRIWVPVLFTYNALDFVFVFSGFILLTLLFLDSSLLESEILKYCLSLIILFFLPGWMVVRFLKLHEKFNKIPVVVISFSVSIGITSIIYTVILILKAEPSGLLISTIYSLLALFPVILRHLVIKGSDKRIFIKNSKKDYNLVEIITLVWISAFFVYSLLYIYPEIIDVPGFDIVRHYAIVSTIDEYSDLFRSPYPWYHLSFGALNDVTDSEMWIFQTGNAFISIILILTFYSMAKAYLYEFKKYAHLLSTIIFVGFSGLGWIFYYQNMHPFMLLNEQFDLFSDAFIATYFDIGEGQGQALWLWFRPVTIGFILTLLLLFLMRMENLKKFTYMILCSLIIITLSLVYFPGLLLFVLIIFCLAVFVPRIRLRVKQMALSLIISLPIAALISISYTILFGPNDIPFNKMHMIILEIISLACFLLLKYSRRVNIPITLNYKRAISVALLIYGILFVYWLTNINAIKDDIFKIITFPGGIYSVPISIFPELLGLSGFLCIPVMVLLLMNNRKNPLVIFPIAFISMLIVGKIISYIIINFQLVDYWERRLIPYLWITVSILSPIAIINLVDFIKGIKLIGRNSVVVTHLITVFFIFFLVVGSMISTFLTLDYHKMLTLSNSVISENEKMLLNDITNLDPHSTILSVTPKSKSITEYQLFNHNVGSYSDLIWPSSSPEWPMNILSGLNSSAILFISNQDFIEINTKGYWNGYLAYHVIGKAHSVEENPTVDKIIEIPRLSPPTSASDMVLILPNRISPSQYFAYDILSIGQYNFTTALLTDIATIKKANTLVVPTEEIANTIVEFRNDLDLNFRNLIILNLDGYGQIGKVDGEYLDPRLNYKDTIQYEYSNNDFDSNAVTYSRQYDNPADLSGYDFIKFDWIGQGKNNNHTIQFSSSSGGTIKYQFIDSWEGPKQLFLPMNLTEINFGFNDIYVQRDVVNNASWSNVSKISILTSDSLTDTGRSINLDDFLFISGLRAENIKLIHSNDTIKLNQSSIIPSTYPFSYETSSTFDNNIPFILQKQGPDYDIHYVNVFPLLQNFNENDFSSSEMYSLYGKILDWLEIDFPTYKTTEKSPYDLVKGGSAAFRNGTFTGDVTMQSSSSKINTDTVESRINIDGIDSDLYNLSQILPLNVDQVQIKSNNSAISGVYGFYTMSIMPHETIAKFSGNPTVLSLLSDNGEESLITGSNITIRLDNADILSRQPIVIVNGVSNFSQFYSFGELNYKIGSLGSDLEVIGNTSFNTKYADKFIWIEKTQLGDKYETEWTKYFRNNGNVNLIEIDSLFKIDTIGYILILILYFCIYNFYITKRKKSKVTKYVI